MTYRYEPSILTYAKYRFVCDHCLWDTGDHELLSDATRALAGHYGAHEKQTIDTPPPIKPSQILDNVRAIR